jgi:hypothetical protein
VDELKTLAPDMVTIKYADDTIILENLSATSVSRMEEELTAISEWCNANNLLINCAKTKEMVFSNIKDNPAPSMLSINRSALEWIECYKYLGTMLTNKLSL